MPDDKQSKRQWFAARTKIGKEIQASVSVASMEGFEVFLPVTLVQRSHARKIETISRPLFPRYLFISFDAALERHGAVNNCRGIANRGLIVTASGRPVAIPDAVIDQIRDREASELARIGEATTGYKPGDVFYLSRGPHAEIEATYMGEENGKVWVTVNMFGRSFVEELDFSVVPRKLVDSRAA